MSDEDRYAQAQGIYKAGLEKVRSQPPPEGQKYAPGARVRIADDLGPHMRHFESGRNATVLYTYAHAYGRSGVHGGVKSYCLDVDGCGSVAWYNESQLTPIPEAAPLSATAPKEAKGRPDAAEQTLREDGIRIPCNESLAQRAAKTQAPRAV